MKSVLLGILATQLLTSVAIAGPITSGGGFALVCRNDNNSIISAELLDLYEAKNKFNYQLLTSTGSLEGDYVASVANTYRLQGYEGDILIDSFTRKNLAMFLEKASFLPKTKKLPHLNDLGNHAKAPAGCAIEALAVWNDQTDAIKIDSEIWDNLDSLSQAALVQHELAYKYQRSSYEKTSESTRAFVGTIFSVNAKSVLDERTRNLPMATGRADDLYTTFHHEKIGNEMKLHFFTIMNRLLVTEATTSIDLTGVQLKSGYSDKLNKFVVIALVDKVKKVKNKILTNQNSSWEIEFTFIPNRPVKIGFYEKGVLLQEMFLTNL